MIQNNYWIMPILAIEKHMILNKHSVKLTNMIRAVLITQINISPINKVD